jgi:hypothetical protein
VNVKKSTFLKETMDGISECVPDSEDSTKSIGSWSEVGNFAQEFEGVTFFLEWVVLSR